MLADTPYTAPAGKIEGSTSLLLGTVLMAQVAGLSAELPPHRAPPVLVAAGLGGARATDAARQGIASILLSLLLLIFPQPAWRRLPRAV